MYTVKISVILITLAEMYLQYTVPSSFLFSG